MNRELSPRPQPGVLATIREERAVARRIRTLQGQAIERRAEDALRRGLATGRMNDMGVATRYALGEGEAIADELAERIEKTPWAAKALGGIAEDGIRGLRHELRRLTED